MRFFPLPRVSVYLLGLLLPVAAMLLAACAGNDQDPTKDWSAERFYNEAKEALNDKNYASAIKHFETLEARYPYGAYSEQAQLELAYAYYKDEEPASAIAAAERFIRLHPTHPHVDYALYIKGLAHINSDDGVLGWLRGGEDLSRRDPQSARDGYDTFRELVTRFPRSKYAKEAGARMGHLHQALAQYEINVAEYYLSRAAYVAAANRAKYVIENYQRTAAVEDALNIQARAYRAMGMNKLMNDSVRVLEKNFPNSRHLNGLRELRAQG